jgi:membrane protease YdiL (CAAX protease family)
VRLRADLIVAAAAAALFGPLFVLRRLGPLDFWWWMSLNLVVLIGLGAILDRGYLTAVRAELRGRIGTKVALGVLSAAGLYMVFWLGNAVARSLLPFAGSGIAGVYGFKTGASLIRVVLLMVFLIGPGEELFWRAFLQRRAMSRFGAVPGFLAVAALYTGVHAASGNAMLVLAAAVCGLFWGAIYLRTRSVLLVAASHTLWDLAVFVVFPFR